MSTETECKHWCTTKTQFVHLSATWTIEHAQFHLNPEQRSGISLQSNVFCSRDGTQKWRMIICSGSNFNSEYLGAYLMVQSEKRIRAEFAISILGFDGTKLKTRKAAAREFENNMRGGFDAYIKLDELLQNHELVPNDTLTLHCEVKAILDCLSYSGRGAGRREASFTLPYRALDKRFESMLHSEKYSDVVIVVGEREIKAHKIMLASASSVFEAMFDSDMEESLLNRVVISDFPYEVVEQMLQYIYTDKVPKLKTMADQLLVAADKYALDRLKVMCEQTLCANLSLDTAVKLLALAELYNAQQLKQHVARFLDDNIKEVRKTADWKDMVEQHSVRLYTRPSRVPLMRLMKGAVGVAFAKIAFRVAQELVRH